MDCSSPVTAQSSVKTLRDRQSMYRVEYHQHGNYRPIDMHGATRCQPGALIERSEQRFDCQFIRPPGSAGHRAASFFTGASSMDECARLGKLHVVCAAETDVSLHEDYYDNTTTPQRQRHHDDATTTTTQRQRHNDDATTTTPQ